MREKPNKIKVVIFEPFKKPYVKEIDNNIDTFQSIVDGWIDYIRLDNNIDIICNDSFLFDKRDYPNRSIFRYGHQTFIFGTFFFVKTVFHDNGNYHISLSDDEINKIISDLNSYDEKIVSKIFDENVLKSNYADNTITLSSKSFLAEILFTRDFLLFRKQRHISTIVENAIVSPFNVSALIGYKDYYKNLSYIEYVLYLTTLEYDFFKIFNIVSSQI